MPNQKSRFASKVKTANKRARKIGADGKITLQEILMHWNDTVFCAICKRFIEESDASLDHLIPLSKGGCNHIDNILIVHSWCNNQKDNKDISDAQDKFSKTYPTEETGSVLIDSGAMYLLQPWAKDKVKRSELPENFGDLAHIEQIAVLHDLPCLIEEELELLKKHQLGNEAENEDT